jgi:hypothetical protein
MPDFAPRRLVRRSAAANERRRGHSPLTSKDSLHRAIDPVYNF